jgi:hypothetical protein
MKNSLILKIVMVLSIFIVSFATTYFIKHYNDRTVTAWPINDHEGGIVTDDETGGKGGGGSIIAPEQTQKPGHEQNPAQPAEQQQEPATADTVEVVVPEIIILDVVVGEPKQDNNTGKYNLTVEIKNLPEKATAEYSIRDEQTNNVIVKSNNGKLRNIPANESEKYKLLIEWTDSLGVQMSPFETTVTGFKPFEKPKPKPMTVEELESKINKQENLSRNSKILPNVKLIFTNIQEGETVPETFDEIYNKFTFNKWTSVKVDAVEYDDNNKITSITITIEHASE